MHSRLERKTPRLARTLKEFETQFKWLAIWLFLLPFRSRHLRRGGRLEPTRVRRVLFLRQDRIGDMVVTLPTIHALKRRYPHIEISVLASPANVSVIEHDSAVSEIHLYNKKRLGETLRTLRHIRRRRYDVAIDLMTGTSITSLILTLLLAKGSFKIGLSKEAFRRYYDYYTREDVLGEEHIAYQIGATLLPFGIDLTHEPLDGAVRLSAEQWEKGAQIVAKLRSNKYERIVGINISAGRINRSWDQARYAATLAQLSRDHPQLQFVISCDPRDYGRGVAVAKAGGDNVAIIPPGLSLTEVIAVISKFDCILSPDTSICHIAAGLGVPLLGFYSGNEHNFNRFHPLGKRVWPVRAHTPDSIDGITVENYAAAFDNMMHELFDLAVTP
ncbi:MAG: lipopolysaccharide heptosyltransferase family protein [Candidatus Zixiibacteriota bacterium]|nr:MAG: lipopolysaccharide heptosyltransferase family protein [candidate division Zixibacteria bacterium]